MKEAFVGFLVFIVLYNFFDFIDGLPPAADWLEGVKKFGGIVCALGAFIGLCYALGYGCVFMAGIFR